MSAVISLILNDHTFHEIYQPDIDSWEELYPAVDVLQELRKMKGWLDSNPAKRKTRKGIKRFINSWLSREQDKGGAYKKPAPSGKKNSFNNFPQHDYDFDQLEKELLGE